MADLLSGDPRLPCDGKLAVMTIDYHVVSVLLPRMRAPVWRYVDLCANRMPPGGNSVIVYVAGHDVSFLIKH